MYCRWPGGHGITSDKVPSEIVYEAVDQPKPGEGASTRDETWSFISGKSTGRSWTEFPLHAASIQAQDMF